MDTRGTSSASDRTWPSESIETLSLSAELTPYASPTATSSSLLRARTSRTTAPSTRRLRDGSRLVHVTGSTVAFVPVFARYAYELWGAPVRPLSSLLDLTEHEFEDLPIVLTGSETMAGRFTA